MPFFKKLMNDEVGATAIEYGLIAALLAISCMGAIQALGDEDAGIWNYVKGKATEALDKEDDGASGS
ncbi:MAG: Flp family type IVb pilin [Pontixanthobacter sp.]